jgi:molybdopterin-guanine dinucleotide biosynthesis protein
LFSHQTSSSSKENLDKVTSRHPPRIVAVGGFTSEVGKTTLLCDLLRAFPGWEAIKTTRGHYRSCGKDPQACCVTHLLEDKPVVKSGRDLTYSYGKDTGRYWDAGAANVHWVIATDGQVEEGINNAIQRVETSGVFIEGNSFTKYIQPDYFIMVARADDLRIKSTARSRLSSVSAFYLSGENVGRDEKELLQEFLTKANPEAPAVRSLPVFTAQDLPNLFVSIAEREFHLQSTAQANPVSGTAS